MAHENEIRTLELGDALVDVLKATPTVGAALKVAMVGSMAQYMSRGRTTDLLPAIIVSPVAFVSEIRSASPPKFTNREHYRIVYLRRTATGEETMREIIEDLAAFVKALGLAAKLPSASMTLPAQVEMSHSTGCEYYPAEDQFMAQFSVPVKAAAIVQVVKWYT